jgi:dTMP kinase
MSGKLIVIEGADGTGKSTQVELLISSLLNENLPVVTLHFPKHSSLFGKTIDDYLDGKFGPKESLSSEFISMLYLTDFYDSKKNLEDLLNQNKIIILSRYYSSTLTYQVALEKENKLQLYDWINSVASRLPKPDLVLVLNVTQEYSEKLMDNVDRSSRDQHEKDFLFQKEVRNVYAKNIEKFKWKEIMCVKNNNLLAKDEIQKLILDEIKKIL